jgi:hypothetical protein
VTTMEIKWSMFKAFGAPSGRSMLTSVALHVPVLVLLMLLPAQVLVRSAARKEIDIVFYRPPEIKIPPRAAALPLARGTTPGGAPPGAPAPALKPKPNAAPGPDRPGRPELPPGPEVGVPVDPQPQPKVGNVGILAFKDKFASLAQDKIVPLLGADARHGAADDIGRPSSPSTLMANAAGSSGINVASLKRSEAVAVAPAVVESVAAALAEPEVAEVGSRVWG